MKSIRLAEHPTLVLFAGAALACLGLAAEPAQQPPSVTVALPTVPVIATADSNEAMIAVTGIDLTGQAILFLVDTERRQLAVYQASGGSSSMSGLRLVGARNIDLDLQLDGYKDKSEYSYKELREKFQQLDGKE